MKKQLLLVGFLLPVIVCIAQDKIITNQSDTIYCRILSVSPTYILYEQKLEGNRVAGRQIYMNQVAVYYRDSKPGKQRLKIENPWVLSIGVGVGHLPFLLESVNMNTSDTYKRIETGVQTGISSHYLLNQSMGIGMQYSFLLSNLNGNFITEIDPQLPVFAYADLRETHYIHFAGPSLMFQQLVGAEKKFFLSETLSVGLLAYRGESQSAIELPSGSQNSMVIQNGLLEGVNVAANAGLTAGYYIQPNRMIGAGLEFMYGRISNANVHYYNSNFNELQEMDNVPLDNPLQLSRFNFSIIYHCVL